MNNEVLYRGDPDEYTVAAPEGVELTGQHYVSWALAPKGVPWPSARAKGVNADGSATIEDGQIRIRVSGEQSAELSEGTHYMSVTVRSAAGVTLGTVEYPRPIHVRDTGSAGAPRP